MTRKGLVLTLITAGLVLAATSAAFEINPKKWFGKAAPASPAPTLVASPAPSPAIIGGVMPNLPQIASANQTGAGHGQSAGGTIG